uniref:Uncharacterized protein n=1 Tax=Sphaerodactylus townsendi TaxID=933632 RepID=A0ACB8G6W7_9SAUR
MEVVGTGLSSCYHSPCELLENLLTTIIVQGCDLMVWCWLHGREHGGFYPTSDQTWVKLELSQFVTHVTRANRSWKKTSFITQTPSFTFQLVHVDHPGHSFFTQILWHFNRAMLRFYSCLLLKHLRRASLTAAMVVGVLYNVSERFTQ